MLHFHELPSEWQHNPFIRSGYRFVPAENWGTLFAGGVFGLHNETLNIHTHLFGAVSVVIVLLSLYWNVFSFPSFMTPAAQTERTLLDFVIASFFLLAATYCFLCSCLFHILSHCSSRTYYYFGANLDYLFGNFTPHLRFRHLLHPLLLLLCSSLDPNHVYGEYVHSGNDRMCPPIPRRRQMVQRSLLQAIPNRILPRSRSLQCCPALPWAWLYGAGETWEVFRPILPSISSYLAGLFFYASNYPEKLFPGGICDYVHSHNLWHLGIIGGVYLHWIALIYIEHFGKESYSCKIR
ncbi:hypothetical protein BT69DRAFT_132327 [Atractiella rhizophila]|nr:hypothetical protein BT69DRAFT_132327 [Atractiella rhizophila]